eukprot:scaffold879_cov410-Prasinococcus_capsulatus_cf.AAC.12
MRESHSAVVFSWREYLRVPAVAAALSPANRTPPRSVGYARAAPSASLSTAQGGSARPLGASGGTAGGGHRKSCAPAAPPRRPMMAGHEKEEEDDDDRQAHPPGADADHRGGEHIVTICSGAVRDVRVGPGSTGLAPDLERDQG